VFGGVHHRDLKKKRGNQNTAVGDEEPRRESQIKIREGRKEELQTAAFIWRSWRPVKFVRRGTRRDYLLAQQECIRSSIKKDLPNKDVSLAYS